MGQPKCRKCKKLITGKIHKKGGVFIGSTLIMNTYCDDCNDDVDEESIDFFYLIIVMFPILAILFIIMITSAIR